MINKRVFGTPIKGDVRKKLEARQQVAGDLKPGESKDGTKMINGVFSDKDGNVQAYLSSQTPFVRMWTSVKIIEASEVADLENSLKEVDVNSADEDKLKEIRDSIKSFYGEEYPRVYIKPIKDPFVPNFILKYVVYNAEVSREQVDYRRRVYEIGNYTYQKKYGEVPINESTVPSTSTTTANSGSVSSEAVDAILPNQLTKNPLLRPQTGITSVVSETIGPLGIIKKTIVGFTINNFYDFDTIFTKYFLVPGATIFIDFGWSSIDDLYNPNDLILDKTKQGEYNNVQNFLYSENGSAKGFITKNQGEVDVIQGIVTDYNAQIQTDGSVKCSVTLTSSNSALLSHKTDSKVLTNIKAILSRGIMYLGIREIVDGVDKIPGTNTPTKDLKELMTSPNFDSPAIDIETYNQNLRLLAQKQLSGKTGPEKNAIRTGIFVDSLDADNAYISLGRFEDLIINSQFGFGSSKDNIINGGNFEVKCNSSYSFANYDTLATEKQHVLLQVPEEPPTVLYPQAWGDYKGRKKTQQGGSYSFQTNKIPTEDYENQENVPDKYQGTTDIFEPSKLKFTKIKDFDKDLGRIPIRELFINVDTIINAFEQNTNVRKVLNQICKEMNEGTDNLHDFKIIQGDTEAEVLFIDSNYSLSTENKKTQVQTDPYFVFNVMSPNSIVKDYNLEFKLPPGDIGNMLAIQGMSHGNTVFSTDKSIDDAVAIGALEPDLLRIVYEPDLGTYAMENLLEEHNDGDTYNVYKSVDYLFDNNLYGVNTVYRNYKPQANVNLVSPSGYKATAGIIQLPLSESLKSSVPGVEDDATPEPTPEALIKQNDDNMAFLGYKVANSYTEYYRYKSTTISRSNRPNLLPYTLSLTTYGISTIQPGDTFQVDYLPKRYIKNTYLQVTKVAHNIGTDGWYTTLDTQFRLRSDVKNIIYDTNEKDKILLSPTALHNAGFEAKLYVDDNTPIIGWDSNFTMSDLSPYMQKVQIEYNVGAPGVDYILLFETTQKIDKLVKEANTYAIYHTSGNFYIRFKTLVQQQNACKNLVQGPKNDYRLKTDPGEGRGYNKLVYPADIYLNAAHKYAIFVKGNAIAIFDREKDNYSKLKELFVNHPTKEEYINPITFII